MPRHSAYYETSENLVNEGQEAIAISRDHVYNPLEISD